ncbi:MAG: hypothetical protein PWP23_2066 [Candidatus Sumerlaeota bacterium]|nr:hypothetical protein [Candidatus Sumerlaeota bacterium]
MRCPYCSTENRDDREKCYHCGKDLSMLRLIRNKAKHHYNMALEHAERGRSYEAMGELKNALELDHHLSEAQLLLGTLYARLDRVEEAREQWERVLANDPNAQRAHDYLCSLPVLTRTLPIVGRVRTLLIAGGSLAVVGVLALAMALWPSREERLLRSAWSEFARPNPGTALQVLSELSRPLSSEEHELSAQLLESSVDRLVRERMGAVNELIAAGEYAEARTAIDALGEWDLPPGYRKALDQTRTLLNESARRDVRELAEAPFTPAGLALLEEKAAELRALDASATAPDLALAAYRQKGEALLDPLLEGIEHAITTRRGLERAEERLEQAQGIALALGQDAAVKRLARQLVEVRYTVRLDEAREALDEGDAARARQVLEADVFAEAPASIAERHAELLQRTDRLMRDQQRDAAHALATVIELRLEEGELEAALDAADELDFEALAEEQREELRRRIDGVRRQYAIDAFYALMQEAEAFDNATLTDAQARTALRRIERIDGHLPPALAPVAHDDLLFFAAASYFALGDIEAAHQRMEELELSSPQSPYLLTWKKLRTRASSS